MQRGLPRSVPLTPDLCRHYWAQKDGVNRFNPVWDPPTCEPLCFSSRQAASLTIPGEQITKLVGHRQPFRCACEADAQSPSASPDGLTNGAQTDLRVVSSSTLR